MKYIKSQAKNILLCICLIGLATSWRLVNNSYHLIPNLEIVTTVSVLAAIILGFRAAFIVPVATMIISDIFIGNTSIFIFTWGSFAVIGLLSVVLRKFNQKPSKQILASFGFAIASSFLFFFVTNFGVWLQGWYPATWQGLLSCFSLAIPFYRTMLIGNMVLVPTSVAIWQFAKYRQIVKLSVVNTLIR